VSARALERLAVALLVLGFAGLLVVKALAAWDFEYRDVDARIRAAEARR
jgi:sensor domain CHASE-containing protein